MKEVSMKIQAILAQNVYICETELYIMMPKFSGVYKLGSIHVNRSFTRVYMLICYLIFYIAPFKIQKTHIDGITIQTDLHLYPCRNLKLDR